MSVQVASLLVKVGADVREATSGLADVDRAFSSTSKKAEQFKGDLSKFTLGAGAVFSGLAAGAGKLAIDFESSFAGVRKTVDATEAEYKSLAGAFRDMSKEIPVSVNELNRIAEAAGQIGVGKEDIVDFTRTVAALGDTTNLAGETAAVGIARFANVTGMAISESSNFAAALVGLGNAGASTESEILEMSLRIAAAGHIAGLTEGDILGVANALSSLGVEAEAGGTAVQKVLLDITQSVAQGNDKLAVFAQVAGMSAENFANAWRTDPGAAFTAFVEGLGKAGDQGFDILEELELADQRLIRAFLGLAGAGDDLNESMGMGNRLFEENNAHIEEANKRWETTASRLRIAMNNAMDLGISIGDHLLPAVVAVADYASANLPRAFDWLDETFGPKIAAAADALGSLAGYAETAARWLGENEQVAVSLAEAFATATVAMLGLGAAMFAVAVMTNPFVLVYAGAVALSFVIIELAKNWDDLREKYVALDIASRAVAQGFEWAADGAELAAKGAVAYADLAVRGVTWVNEKLEDMGLKWEFVAGLLGGPVAMAVTYVIRHWDELTEAVRRAPDAVWEFIKDLPDLMWDAGKAAAEAFANGIEAGASAIGRAVSKYLDPRNWDIPGGSPLMHAMNHFGREAGLTFTEGLASGVDAGASAVEGRVQELARRVYSAVQGVFAALQGAAVYGPAVSTATSYKGDYLQGPHIGLEPEEIEALNREAASNAWNSAFSGFSGSGGGGAAEAAKTAAEEFAAAWVAEARSGSLAEAFGETGGSLMDAFAQALESPSSAARLPDIITRLVDEAKDAGVPNATELGEQLATAIAAGLETGAAGGIETALKSLTDQVTEAGKLTVENFATALSARAADRRLLDQIGSGGKSIMDALSKAVEEGGQRNIASLADQVDKMVGTLASKAPEAQAAYLGTSLTDALTRAIESGGMEAEGVLSRTLANINSVLIGGAIDIRTGTVIAADAVKDLAKAFGVSAPDIVENISYIVESGLLNMIDALDKLPAAAQEAISKALGTLASGKGDIDAAIDSIARNLPGYQGPGKPSTGDTSQTMPGETIAELVARVTGVDVFGGEGSVFDQNGRYMSASDITAAVISGKFVSDFIYGKYSTGANPMVSGSVTKEGFIPNPPYDGSHEMGLPYVPFDGYLAQLHKGERVVPARENRGYGTQIIVQAIDAQSVESWLRNGGAEQIWRAVRSEAGREW